MDRAGNTVDTERPSTDLILLHHRLRGDARYLLRLVQYFGSATRLLADSDVESLAALGIPEGIARAIHAPVTRAEQRAQDAAMRWVAAGQQHILVFGEPGYPARLAEIHDPPLLLFAAGEVGLLDTHQVAIVGSRKLTMTGRKVARMLAGDLCRAGVTITSGMALGIDAAAHQGALDANGKTIAVLGSGCDLLYPASNKRLGERIRDGGGLLVSEFPLGCGARAHHFPQRNRIVTGLCLGTVVVEAALRSGSLVSARLAMEQGREVFAVPGSVLNPMSRGCHKLLREGAKLTESAEDILEELEAIVGPRQGIAPSIELTPGQAQLLALMGGDAVSVDSLVEGTGMAVAEVLATLLALEIDGLVQAEAGGYALSAQGALQVIGH